MKELNVEIEKILKKLNKKETDFINERLEKFKSIPPFNKEHFLLTTLVSMDKLSIEEYDELYENYKFDNQFLHVFENSSPRGFGEVWAQKHIMKIDGEFQKPSKTLDSSYSGEYDLILPINLDLVKIEVKASRAVDKDIKRPLFEKALYLNDNNAFWMNFQQVKPACADTFVFVGVWRDGVRYWVFSSKELLSNKYYSKGQHRGNVGEGQLHIKDTNIDDFEDFECSNSEVKGKIINSFLKNNQQTQPKTLKNSKSKKKSKTQNIE